MTAFGTPERVNEISQELVQMNMQLLGPGWMERNYGSVKEWRNSRDFQQVVQWILSGQRSLDSWRSYVLDVAKNDPDSAYWDLPPFERRQIDEGMFSDAETQDAFARVQGILQDWFPQENAATLSDWLWGEITAGTPQTQIFLDLYKRPEFVSRFAGIFDEEGRFIMTPAAYVNYERDLEAALNSYNITPEDHGVTFEEMRTALISQRRSIDEVVEDFEMLDVVEQNPFLRRQFFAATGIDPGTEGTFALLVGLPEADDLRAAYEESTGLPLSEVEARISELGLDDEEAETMRQAFLDQQAPEFESVLDQMEKRRSFRRAVLADRARFERGGSFAVESEMRRETF